MLDNRLKMCMEMVSGRGIVCDVGTDHAMLAAELVTSGKCRHVIASDINVGPLESAKKTVEKYGIEDKVSLVLSDGLANVDLEGVSDIVIAGMGGETIADIILSGAIYDDDIRLVLQPMTKPEVLRKRLYAMYYHIVEERAVEAAGKMYTVICAERCDKVRDITEFEAIAGFFDPADKMAAKYREKEAERLEKIGDSLRNARVSESEAVHCYAMSRRLREGVKTTPISTLYEFLNEKYPFELQEKWDNSGFLVESLRRGCSKLLLTLDISNVAVTEARRKGVNFVISHHPVIFDPLKQLDVFSPAFNLVQSGIGAVCMHTNLDIAEGGTNSVIVAKLAEKLDISGDAVHFDEMWNGTGLGYIVELREPIDCDELAKVLKEIFGCPYVRMNRFGHRSVSKIAICSGSGGSMLELAVKKECHALITGDVKHDVMVTANNKYITVFDCGHFHTENLVLPELRRVIEEEFPCIDVEIAESSVDPCVYF